MPVDRLGHVRWFVLDDHNELVQVTLIQWAVWFETAPEREGYGGCGLRQVAFTSLPCGMVSTVFVGLDTSLTYGPARAVFETVVFSEDEKLSSGPTRYDTWREAEEGHARTVQMLSELEPESTIDGRIIYR